MTKSNVKKVIETTEDVTRKIWLAGLGAYGKGFDEIQGRYEKINDGANRIFDELVSKGEKIEEDTKVKIKEKTLVDQRVQDVRKKLGFDSSDTDTKIEELTAKIDQLTATVEKASIAAK